MEKHLIIYLVLFLLSGCAIFTPRKHKAKVDIKSTIDSIVVGFKERDTTILKKFVHKKVYDFFMEKTDSLSNDEEVKEYIRYFDRDWEIDLDLKGDTMSAKVYKKTTNRKRSMRHYTGINYLLKVDSKWVIDCHNNRFDGFRGTCVE